MAYSNAKLYTTKEFTWTNEPIDILGVTLDDQEELVTSINYDNILVKAEDVLKCWSNRNISLLGKVLIINT